jgi:hypothetical protein
MVNNMEKILICVYVPLIEKEYDVYIPINKKIGYIKKLLIKSINELSDNNFKVNNNITLSNKLTSYVYDEEEFVYNTDIRNGVKLVIL